MNEIVRESSRITYKLQNVRRKLFSLSESDFGELSRDCEGKVLSSFHSWFSDSLLSVLLQHAAELAGRKVRWYKLHLDYSLYLSIKKNY